MVVKDIRSISIVWSDIAIIASLLMIVIVFVLTAGTSARWVGHALAGIISLIFSVAAALVGAILVGRVKGPKGIKWFRLHRKIAIWLAVIITITFVQGLFDRYSHVELLFWQHTEPLTLVIKGWLGLTVTIVAIVQVLLSLVVKDRRKVKKIHMMLGYTLIILLAIITILGIEAAWVESTTTAFLPGLHFIVHG
jgi:hypothetical protein